MVGSTTEPPASANVTADQSQLDVAVEPSASGAETRASVRLAAKDLIPDRALTDANADALDHDAVAAVLTDLVCNVQTPANVALFGPWGSGKSSIYGMLRARLVERTQGRSRVALVRYDAWKFGGLSLQRNFLTHMADELDLKPRHLAKVNGATETSRLRLGRFLIRNWMSLLLALAVAATMAALWAVGAAWASKKWGVGNGGKTVSFSNGLIDAMPSAAVVFGAVIAGLLLSNQVLASAVEKRIFAPMQDADQFFGAFNRLMKVVTRRRLLRRRVTRLVVFIDELDRCNPDDVVKTLTDLLTFLDHKQCVFVVAADREVLEEALENAPQAKPIRENEPYYSTSGAFFDKVFQHQVALPPTRPEALTAYAMRLADEREGLWADLRTDSGVYEDVVYSLVPAHVRSPRRVKVLMNNFVTNMRVMESRALNAPERAVELAVMTVLQTEFPSVVRDFTWQPLLLQALTHLDGKQSPELAALVEAYDPDKIHVAESKSVTNSAAPLLTGRTAETDTVSETRARKRLNEQLHAYLGKIHAADIALPSSDLVYLQPAGHADGLTDADLARLLDIAADTAPDDLVGAFEGASDADKTAAVRYLTTQVANSWGPARANLVESACRLAQELPLTFARETARSAASTVLSEARSARWRPEATAGAIWLGLLDEQISDPLALLAPTGELDQIADNGTLSTLVPLLPGLRERASALYLQLIRSYDNHPDLLHAAITTLYADQTITLWAQAAETVRTQVITDSHSAPAVIASAAAEVSTADASGTPPFAPSQPGDLFRNLLSSFMARPQANVDPVVVDAIRIAFDPGSNITLYESLWELRSGVRSDALSADSSRDAIALEAIAKSPVVDHLAAWAADLTLETRPDLVATRDAAMRLISEIATGDAIEGRTILIETLPRLTALVSDVQAEDLATAALEALTANPPSGTPTNLEYRRTFRDILGQIEQQHPTAEYESAYTGESLLRAIKDQLITKAGIAQAKAEIESLTPRHAEHLDAKASEVTGDPNQLSTVVRLRIVARQTAGMKPVPVSDVIAALPSDQGSVVPTEWASSNPRYKDMFALRAKFKLPAKTLGVYAAKRNITERSRLWIAAEKRDDQVEVLEEVGRLGVNATVVNHMASRIIGATLATQNIAVRRLATANLAVDKGARVAAHEMALKLLSTNLAGAGANATKIVLSAKGSAPGRKPELRAAFDAYTTEVTNHRIPQADTRSLVVLGLLTKRKTSPLAKMLGWFTD